MITESHPDCVWFSSTTREYKCCQSHSLSAYYHHLKNEYKNNIIIVMENNVTFSNHIAYVQIGSKHMYQVEILFPHHSSKALAFYSLYAHGPYSSSSTLHISTIHLCQCAYLGYISRENIWLHQLTLVLGFLTWGLWSPKMICRILCLGTYVPYSVGKIHTFHLILKKNSKIRKIIKTTGKNIFY